MKIILGSSSAGRKIVMEELGQELGFSFEVMSPDIDEKAIRREDPGEMVMAVANAKADALLARITEPSLLIVSDQVVLYEGKVREKPVSADVAREFLRGYCSAPAQTLGAVVAINTANGKRASSLQTAKIYFKQLPEEFIDEHVRSGVSLRGAGGFVVQDPLLKPYIDRIEGDFDSAVGLSKAVVKKLIKDIQ